MGIRTLLKRIEQAEKALVAQSIFSADCICFPENEPPFFCFPSEEEIAAKVSHRPTQQHVDYRDLASLIAGVSNRREICGRLCRSFVGGALATQPRVANRLRFDGYRVGCPCRRTAQARRKVRLRGQPLQVLEILLERAGDVVTREELQSRIWPADTFVDFDHSLHNADCADSRSAGRFGGEPALHRDPAAPGIPVHRSGTRIFRRCSWPPKTATIQSTGGPRCTPKAEEKL